MGAQVNSYSYLIEGASNQFIMKMVCNDAFCIKLIVEWGLSGSSKQLITNAKYERISNSEISYRLAFYFIN